MSSVGHPGQAGAQLSPGTGSSSAGRALALGGSACMSQGCHIAAATGCRVVHELPYGTYARRCLCLECFVSESWP